MKKYDFTVFGCATSVCVLKVDNLPTVGKSVWVENSNAEIFNGGVGFNISTNLSMLGAHIYPILSYSDERHYNLSSETFAPKFKWPTDGLFSPPQGANRMCYIFQDKNKDHMTVMYRYGENADSAFDSEYMKIDLQEEFVNDSKYVIFASPRPVNTEPIFRLLQRTKTPFVFSYRNDSNIYPDPLLKEILLNTAILFVNEFETKEIVQKLALKDITDLFQVGQARVVVTTMGKRGSIVYSLNKDNEVEKILVPITENEIGNIDAVGAGDAFLSGFMYGYAKHKSLTFCAQLGSTMSSFVIEKDGSTTNTPTLQQVLERNATRPDAVYE